MKSNTPKQSSNTDHSRNTAKKNPYKAARRKVLSQLLVTLFDAIDVYRRRPRRPLFRRVQSDGIGVTSSIRPIFIPFRARALKAD